ncbi:nuclear transport factor 2 family protein [Oscillatoria sp. CS-180]|uniref:nuclear transport factor 2 family protein n=1 Tax=Oscillatoria sp. CS-180 TaxID=3021720 RepID=UPI00232EFDED|nr:nuclear transport factor 2 family protein [Oscillatoria sp. CS-180]MDB9528492.1 nuclear transport factor 2 family protein [Oscillatoria sp. CS-180]
MKTVVNKNLLLLQRLEKLVPHDLESAQDLIGDNFVWHYFNPALPEIAGDYMGLSGLQEFFQKLSRLTEGTFKVETHQVIPVGEELVVVHANPSMTFDDKSFELDAVVVWRIVDDRITEAWDIPSIFTLKHPSQADQMPGAA